MIGQTIYQARKALGYSQETLAEKCGVSRQAVSRWERGEICPETERLIVLSRALALSLDELLLGGGKARHAACGRPQMEEKATGFQGILIKESLKNDTVLDFIQIRRVELWQTQGNPRYWTAILFASECRELPAQVQACLNEGWFADMKWKRTKYIIFSDQILQYEIGNPVQEQAVRAACRLKGIAEEQMNWPE